MEAIELYAGSRPMFDIDSPGCWQIDPRTFLSSYRWAAARVVNGMPLELGCPRCSPSLGVR